MRLGLLPHDNIPPSINIKVTCVKIQKEGIQQSGANHFHQKSKTKKESIVLGGWKFKANMGADPFSYDHHRPSTSQWSKLGKKISSHMLMWQRFLGAWESTIFPLSISSLFPRFDY